MAHLKNKLIIALRQTALRLESSETMYRWSHFAQCNCGHLVQTLTGLEAKGIQERAMTRDGDWGEQAAARQRKQKKVVPMVAPDYGDRIALDEGAWEPENIGACSATGNTLDFIFNELEKVGLSADDIRNLERLSDPQVRRRLGTNTVDYPHYKRENVIAYLRAWADELESKLFVSTVKQGEPWPLAEERESIAAE